MSSIIKSSDVIFNDNPKKTSGVNSLNINTLGAGPNISQINREKETIIEKAIKDAKDIIDNANESKLNLHRDAIKECGLIKQQAYNEGFEAGQADGKKAGEQEAYIATKKRIEDDGEKALSELLKMIYLIEDGKDSILKRYEEGIINVASDIARKIIKTELKTNKEIIKNMLLNSLSTYKKCEWINIYVTDDEYITVSTDKEIADRLSRISDHIRIEKTKNNTEGELVIETPDNIVDLGTDNQLKNLEKIILGVQEN